MPASNGLNTRGIWTPSEIAQSMALYAITDRTWLGDRTLGECAREVLLGGATFLQLREKNVDDQEMLYSLAYELMDLCQEFHVPFVIDDDVEFAKEVGADGVHVGQSDSSARYARELLGPDAIVGVSAQTVDQAIQAQQDGADYLGVGAVFSTSTKDDADSVSLDELARICAAVDIPVVAIGGINQQSISKLEGTGIDGVAVISALFAADDIESATYELAQASRAIIGKTKGNA